MLREKKIDRCFDLFLKKNLLQNYSCQTVFWLKNFDLFTENTNPLLKKSQKIMQKILCNKIEKRKYLIDL